MSKVISQLSGGFDSTAVLIKLLNEGHEVKCLFFNIGQVYLEQERKSVAYIDKFLSSHKNYKGVEEIKINMELSRNADGSPSAYIPIRNMVFGTLSANYALAKGYNQIAVGNKTTVIRENDPYCFKDCSFEFYNKITDVINFASEDGDMIEFIMPLVTSPTTSLTKGDVVNIIKDSGMDFNDLWSCYEDGDLPCGKCYHCLENQTAFNLAGIDDPLNYKS